MSVRWEPSESSLELTVRDLVTEQSRFSSGGSGLAAPRRARLGSVEHERMQAEREREHEGYRRELTLLSSFVVDGVKVTLRGRVDGLFEAPDGALVVEEFKTVLADAAGLARLDEGSQPAYGWQLRVYAWMLRRGARGPGAPEVDRLRLALVYVALPSREHVTLELAEDDAGCEGYVRRRVVALVATERAADARRARRRALATRVTFPYGTPRRYQAEIMKDLSEALAEGRRAMLSAATGLGKTVATLVPALESALARGGQVFFATSKTTQQAIAVETARHLRGAGVELRAVVLTAREKLCQKDVVLCHPELCEFARDYDRRFEASGLASELRSLPVIDAEVLVQRGVEAELCPAEIGLDALLEADLIIGDYNYVFDPSVALKRIFQEQQGSGVVLVVDEAHNLVERGRGYFSPELRKSMLAEALEGLRGRRDRLARRLRGALERLGEALSSSSSSVAAGSALAAPRAEPKAATSAGDGFLFDDPELKARERRLARSRRRRAAPKQAPRRAPQSASPESRLDAEAPRCVSIEAGRFVRLRDELEGLMVAEFVRRARAERALSSDDPLLTVTRALSRFCLVAEQLSEQHSVIERRLGPEAGLRIFCKDASGPLGDRFAGLAGAILASATLWPFEFYRRLLGVPEDALRLQVGSPFPASARGVFIDVRVSLAYRARERERPAVASAIREVVAARPGNILVCCPSYEYLGRLSPLLEAELAEAGLGVELCVQRPGLDDAARAALLAKLDAYAQGERSAPALLLAVQGGVFSEGVDYPGELCVGVVIVGPAFPALSFERKLLQAYFEERYGRGFDYAFRVPGMSRVVQCAGRVHRRPTDRGVIVLIGSRFLDRGTDALLPRAWYSRRPSELATRDLGAALARFWAGDEELQ